MGYMDKDCDGTSFLTLDYSATFGTGYVDHKGVPKTPKKPFSLLSGYFELSRIVKLRPLNDQSL